MAIGDIKAGRAYVEVGTDNTQLNKGLAGAQAKVMSFGTKLKDVSVGMAALGAAAVAAGYKVTQFLVAGLTSAVERGSEFVDIADRLGADVEGIQKISFAAGRMGIEFEQVNAAIKKMQKALGEGKIDKELRQIGLEADAFIGLSADEAFFRVVDALRSVSDQNEQAALTTKLFGRAGQDLQAVIKAGSAELDRMGAEGQALGVIMGEDLARGFEQAGDAAEDASKAIEGLWNQKWFQERIAGYADLISEIVTLGDAQTEFYNSQQIKIEKYNARQKQAAIDQENAVRFTEAQAAAAEEKLKADAGTAAMMADQLASMQAMVAPAKELIAAEEKRIKLRDDNQRRAKQLFEATRTPEEQAKADEAEARSLFRQGLLDVNTLARRLFQISKELPQKAAGIASSAGTFNPFAARGLSDNERLTKAAEETAKNTKKLADKAAQGLVFH